MSDVALSGLSIAEARRAIVEGRLSPVALTQAYLDRIAAGDETHNAYRTVTAELALEQAGRVEDAARRGDPVGPLAGVPVALKDNIEVAGVPMTAGTSYLADNVAEHDAPVWERMRDAGAVLLGKVHMSEWAIGGTTQNEHFGPCRNSWDPERVSGGSSGGSGVALGTDMAHVTLGTDTGGSIRIPSALNGVCGLRGTAGRVSNRGSIPVAWTFDTIGPMSRRAEDVARVLAVIAGYDPLDPVSADVPVDDYVGALEHGAEGLRIGLLTGYWQDDPDPEVAVLVREAAEAFERLGAEVAEVHLDGHAQALEWTAELLLAEAASFHADRLHDEPHVFAPDVHARLHRGASITGPHYGRGRQEQRIWRRRVQQALDGHDLLLAPACGLPAPRIDESDPLAMTGRLARFISMWVLARTPVLAVPCGFTQGLPVGMQLVGHPFGEAALLRAAHAYQQATDWHLRRPEHAWARGGETV
jgi:aspartyl-tRNA(Asn)/glutamyl-tRNA(Gln) amidotransferase subunit A